MAKIAVVSKWGNAHGIRLPEAFCRQLGIAVGDKVSLTIVKDKLIVENAIEQNTIEARFKKWNGKGSPEPVDWGAPVGKEIW